MSSKWNFWSGLAVRSFFAGASGLPLSALSDESEPSIVIDERPESGSICFRACGLSGAVLRSLSHLNPFDAEFVDRFSILEIDSHREQKLVNGAYFVEGRSLVFIPEVPIQSTRRYLATLRLPDPLSNRDVGSLFSLQSEFAPIPSDVLAA